MAGLDSYNALVYDGAARVVSVVPAERGITLHHPDHGYVRVVAWAYLDDAQVVPSCVQGPSPCPFLVDDFGLRYEHEGKATAKRVALPPERPAGRRNAQRRREVSS